MPSGYYFEQLNSNHQDAVLFGLRDRVFGELLQAGGRVNITRHQPDGELEVDLGSESISIEELQPSLQLMCAALSRHSDIRSVAIDARTIRFEGFDRYWCPAMTELHELCDSAYLKRKHTNGQTRTISSKTGFCPVPA